MNSYVRLPQAAGETAPVTKHFDFVYVPDDATRMSYDDADYFRKRAFEKLPDLDWQVEKAGEGKYVVRGERRDGPTA
jgi:hypothetical protein